MAAPFKLSIRRESVVEICNDCMYNASTSLGEYSTNPPLIEDVEAPDEIVVPVENSCPVTKLIIVVVAAVN